MDREEVLKQLPQLAKDDPPDAARLAAELTVDAIDRILQRGKRAAVCKPSIWKRDKAKWATALAADFNQLVDDSDRIPDLLQPIELKLARHHRKPVEIGGMTTLSALSYVEHCFIFAGIFELELALALGVELADVRSHISPASLCKSADAIRKQLTRWSPDFDLFPGWQRVLKQGLWSEYYATTERESPAAGSEALDNILGELSRDQQKMIEALWNKRAMRQSEFITVVWGGRQVEPDSVKRALSRINERLNELCAPVSIRSKNSQIVLDRPDKL